jgi:predicted DsbA family dithiol-disulfide isomerase/uncharacterized membrane protein
MTAPKSARVLHWAQLLLVCVALGASVSLLIDYLRPRPVFCGEDSGCEAVKHTPLAYLFGVVPTPALGVLAFVTCAVLLHMNAKRGRYAHAALAVAMALVAAGLLVVQKLMGTFCAYCVVVDVISLVLLPAALLRLRGATQEPLGKVSWGLGMGAVALAIAGPVALGSIRKAPPVPSFIADEIKKTPAGQITVVDFVDFECPWCRLTHEELRPVLASYPGRVRVVRKHVPLERLHPHAIHAARAACCAREQGREDAMAEELFATDPETFSPEVCEGLAARIQLDVPTFRACVASERPNARIAEDRAQFKNGGGRALPTLWVGEVRLTGAQSELSRVFKRAQ